ncbi:MAG TPA: diacylglycerol kinase family protein [Actinomycetes bacterium]|nr:diacylglycerol kinase family protein [Actinomycetes bacterium]
MPDAPNPRGTPPTPLRLARPGGDTLPFGMPLLVGDAAAGRRGLDGLRRALAREGVVADAAVARAPGRGRKLAEQALAAGTRLLVAVGDDRLAHELAVAVLAHTGTGRAGQDAPLLGLAGLGRQDLAATFGLPDAPEEAARHLLGGGVFTCDVGRVRWRGPDGAERRSLFVNVAELGYPAVLSARRQRLEPAGRLGRLVAAASALATSRSTPAHLELAHAGVDLRLAGLVIANGQFSMGRMKVAPRAVPDDGRLSVIGFEGEPVGIYARSGKLHYGEHLPDPAIREYQSPTVRVQTAEPVPLALDGTPVAGGPPVEVDVLPAALRVKI